MKGLFLVLFLFLLLSEFAIGQNGKVTVTVSFKDIEEGHDFLTRDELYVDGKLLQVTEERLQSKTAKLKIEIPLGQHTIKIVNWTLYEGVWEEKTIENNYNLDAYKEVQCIVKKKGKLSVIYYLNENEVFMTYN